MYKWDHYGASKYETEVSVLDYPGCEHYDVHFYDKYYRVNATNTQMCKLHFIYHVVPIYLIGKALEITR